MLMKTERIYQGNPAPQATRHVSGQYLAKNRLTARARARLAADIIAHRVEISALTVKQVSKLCGLVPTINAARRSPSDELVIAWNAASNAERVEFARRVGVGRVWDQAIVPAID